jgi:hypothetical protein
VLAAIVLCALFVTAQEPPPGVATKTAMNHAHGSFDVKLTPQKPDNQDAETAKLGRISLTKQFHGELEATSTGEMLYAGDATTSGGYVALERVTGTLAGRKGSFVLQHSGTMSRGHQHLTITVVPDSGTGELQGLTGQMEITQKEGKHSYDFNYTLPTTSR